MIKRSAYRFEKCTDKVIKEVKVRMRTKKKRYPLLKFDAKYISEEVYMKYKGYRKQKDIYL